MSVMIQRDEDTARAVEQAARRYLDPAPRGIEQRLARLGLSAAAPPAGEPADEPASLTAAELTMPDFRLVQLFGGPVIRVARENLVAANEAHEREVQDDVRRRQVRDEAALSAREILTRVRRVLEGAVGPEAASEMLGIAGPTPDVPSQLLSRLNDAIGRIESPKRGFPELLVPGMALDWSELLGSLTTARNDLDAALEAVGEDRRDVHVTLDARQAAERDFRDTYVAWTRILDGLYLFAGKRAFAQRLRPTVPSRSGAATGEPLPEEPPVVPPPGEPLPELPAPPEEPLPGPPEDTVNDPAEPAVVPVAA